jgi:OOP family OmpA-OmpF porin
MDGCPQYIEVSPDNQIVFKRPIRFERGTANLTENSFEVIDELAAAIIANPLWEEVHIYVHMSGRGNMEANQEISDQRAMAVLRLLVAAGVLPERLVAVGKGNTEPIASADTPEGRKQNTRVEVRVQKGATP